MSAPHGEIQELPASAADYGGMPVRMATSPVLWVRMQTDPARTAAALPPGLHPALPGVWVLGIANFHCTAPAVRSYNEWSAFIPTRAGLWIAQMYLDDLGGIVMGREVYGMPKQLARLQVGTSCATMTTARAWGRAEWTPGPPGRADEVAGELGETTTAIPARLCAAFERTRARFGLPFPPVRMLARRVVPAIGRRRPLADELVSIRFRTTAVEAIERADATVQLPDDHHLGGTAVAAWSTRIAFELTGARRIRSYR